MKIKGFDIEDSSGNLIETLPAILYKETHTYFQKFTEDGITHIIPSRTTITAQVPQGVTLVDFLDDATGKVLATDTVVDGKATLDLEVNQITTLIIRVGEKTKSGLNKVEVVVRG